VLLEVKKTGIPEEVVKDMMIFIFNLRITEEIRAKGRENLVSK
jgi:hypothetical protein